MRSRTRQKQGKEFNSIVHPQSHPPNSALSTCSALSRQVGTARLSDCLPPPRAPPCNLFLYLATCHVTFVFQLYPNCTFCVFSAKKLRFFTFSTFLFLSSVIELEA